MKKRFLSAPIALLAFGLVATQAAQSGDAAPGSLKTFMERQGFGGSQLQRRFGNHLFATTIINGRRSALMIDSGCPNTLINRTSARRLGLGVQETKGYIVSVSGRAERAGVSKVATLAMGNCTFTNVPVDIAAEEQINFIARPHLDGLFGAHELSKFGMVIDCARQMLYVNPRGPSQAASQKLAQFLAVRGFSRIPMRLNSGRYFDVAVALNGHPTQLTVDSGAGLTLISAPVAAASGVTMSSQLSYHGEGIGYIKEMMLGNLLIHNAEVGVARVPKFVGAGLFGEEYLSWNFAVIDFGGMNLFLRPPDTAPTKKR